jgi:hypothetical protein
MEAAVDKKIESFEALLQWFESADDPWFEEKRGHRLGQLRGMQAACCPCGPIGSPYGLHGHTDQQLRRVLELLRRSNSLSPYTAHAACFVEKRVGGSSTRVEATHVEGCACAAPPPAPRGWLQWLLSH